MRYKNLRSHSLKVTLLVKSRYIGSNPFGVEAFALIEAGTVSIKMRKRNSIKLQIRLICKMCVGGVKAYAA